MALRVLVPAFLVLGALMGASPSAEFKTIKDVMALHKGKESMFAKISDGKGSADEIKNLVAAYEALGGFKPPMGDEKSWKDKTAALLAAAKDLSDKKDGAAAALKKAGDCKACHSVHKPAK